LTSQVGRSNLRIEGVAVNWANTLIFAGLDLVLIVVVLALVGIWRFDRRDLIQA